MDIRRSFDAVAAIYDRARPEYPEPAFEDLFAYLGETRSSSAPDVIEIGPGTGQATGALLARGARVTAVELGSNLARSLRTKFAANDHLEVVVGAFEDVALPEAAFDLVFAATAFHWLDAELRVEKTARLLRLRGVLATLSTLQIRSEVDCGFFERTFPTYQRYRPDERWIDAPIETDATPADYEEFAASDRFEGVAIHRYRWDQRYSTEEYEDLVRSYSNTQTMEPAAREGLIADLRAVIDEEFGGYVVRPLVIALTLARRRSDADYG